MNTPRFKVGQEVYVIVTHWKDRGYDVVEDYHSATPAEVISFDDSTIAVWIDGEHRPTFLPVAEVFTDAASADRKEYELDRRNPDDTWPK